MRGGSARSGPVQIIPWSKTEVHERIRVKMNNFGSTEALRNTLKAGCP
jgi:hypothetical protein